MAAGSDEYRRDIDGLRAVAVTSVVAFHAGLPGVPGGFVGVDVFFVISGFLITRLLLAEAGHSGRIDPVEFFARRARRLLPAFALVAATSLVLGAVFLVPLHNEQIGFARTVSCAALYVANWCFAAKTDGYFERGAETFPFLHTWSLSVEEQFYFVWPALLIALIWMTRRFALDFRRAVLLALATIFAASLSFAIVGALAGAAHGASSTFYHTGGRAWELAAGGLLAAAWPSLAHGSRAMGEIAARLGLVAIAGAVMLYDGTISYPGYAALLPVAGTAAVIVGGGIGPQGLVPRLLSLPPVVAIGLVSYGWYLWHWPLLAIARSHGLGEHDTARDVALALLALAVAGASYRLIEEPIRRRKVFTALSREKTLIAAGFATISIVLASNVLSAWSSHRIADPADRLAPMQAALRDINPLRLVCNQDYPFAALPADPACVPEPSPGRATTVLVWGDSHADHLVPLVTAAGDRYGWTTAERTLSACPPLLGVTPIIRGVAKPDCKTFNDAVFRDIEELAKRGPLKVVVAGRWLAYLDTPVLAVEDRPHIYRLADRVGHGAAASLAVMKSGLSATLDALGRLGVQVVVAAPVPEQRYSVPWCLARRTLSECSSTRVEVVARRADTIAALNEVTAGRRDVRLVDPLEALCEVERCPAARGGAILYSDDDHLSATASRGLAPWFDGTARWLAGHEALIR